MKIVNNYLILILLISVTACQQKETFKTEVANDTNTSKFQLKILDTYADSIYKTDERGKSKLLIVNKICVLDSCFNAEENMQKVFDYVKEHEKVLNSPNNIRLETFIKIKNIENIYEDVWNRSESISFYFDQDIGGQKMDLHAMSDIKIDLKECFVKYNARIAEGLKISFYDTSSDEGYKIYMLNFIRDKESWVLVSRERLNTIENEANGEPLGYCYDTINANCITTFKRNKVIKITNEMLYDLTHEKCY